MSIVSEISRLKTDKASIKTAIENKGVPVPSNALIDSYSSYVDAISGGGGTISPYSFEYDNWISYSSTAPDATKYKYWVQTSQTPSSAPLKMCQFYTVKNYFSGDIDALIQEDNCYDLSSLYSSSFNGVKFNDDYLICSTSFTDNWAVNNFTYPIYVYKINGKPNPIGYARNMKNVYRRFYTQGLSQDPFPGGSICLLGNKIYVFNEPSRVPVYDIESGTIDVLSGFLNVSSSSLRIIAATPMYDEPTSILIVAVNTGATTIDNIIFYKYNPITQLSSYITTTNASTGYQINSLRPMHDTGRFLILGYATAIGENNKLVVVDKSNYAVSVQETLGTLTKWHYCQIVVSKNEIWFSESNTTTPFVEKVNNSTGLLEQVNLSNYGNLFQAIAVKCPNIGFNLSQDSSTFIADIPSSVSLTIDGVTSNVFVYGDNSAVIIEGETTKNYSLTTESRPNHDSTNNILLPCNNKTITSQGQLSLFYPRSDVYMPLICTLNGYNHDIFGIYQGDSIPIKVSSDGAWVNVDQDDLINLGY